MLNRRYEKGLEGMEKFERSWGKVVKIIFKEMKNIFKEFNGFYKFENLFYCIVDLNLT